MATLAEVLQGGQLPNPFWYGASAENWLSNARSLQSRSSRASRDETRDEPLAAQRMRAFERM